MILVTAAQGNQGTLLIPKLLATNGQLRACVRSDESARTLRDAGVADVVVGDIADEKVLARAMQGVTTVYYVSPALHPGETRMGFAAIDAARAAGVRHFVFSSVLHPILTDLVQHQSKRDIEEYLVSSGLAFTILQPANYMLRHRLISAFEQGVFRLSWSLDRSQSMVDVDDVTDVAAAVLSDPHPHAGATYELAAPSQFTAHEIAAVISEVTGRPVVAAQMSPDAFLQTALGVGSLTDFPYQTEAMRAITARYSSHDFVGNPNVLTWLLGRPPTTFDQFVRREFQNFQSSARDQSTRLHPQQQGAQNANNAR